MHGTMLWFNLEKGYGFICTDEGERLAVDAAAFLPGHEPEPRCKGRLVAFERRVVEDEARAVGVSFLAEPAQRRARLHQGRGGRAL